MTRELRSAAVVAAVALLAACGGKTENAPAVQPAPGAAPQQAPAPGGAGPVDPNAPLPPGHPPMPGAAPGGGMGEMPPGHPPMGGGAPGGMQPMIQPPPAEAGKGATALGWTVPGTWKVEVPSSQMRRAQYRVPGPGGDGECVVFYFGPGEGGPPRENAMRWAAQFVKADGSPATDLAKTSDITVGGVPVLLVEVAGTYVGGMGSAAAGEKSNYMLLGAVAQGPDSNWFFKFTGPEATVKANRAAFDGMLKSLKKGA